MHAEVLRSETEQNLGAAKRNPHAFVGGFKPECFHVLISFAAVFRLFVNMRWHPVIHLSWN